MKHLFLILVLAGLLLPAALLAETFDITGVWFTGEKTSKIEIYKTTSGKFAGKIVWLKVPNDEAGKPRLDVKNPDKNLKGRPLMNLVVLTGLTDKGKNKFDGGTIYDPKSGNTYSCKGELTDNNTLKLRGFIGISLVGRTDTWTRTTK
jgi:uncharacterized protein (DUF2147 family)